MQINDYIRTPRFCTVKINAVFVDKNEMRAAGYTEPTHYIDAQYEVCGKSVGDNKMVFTAALK